MAHVSLLLIVGLYHQVRTSLLNETQAPPFRESWVARGAHARFARLRDASGKLKI